MNPAQCIMVAIETLKEMAQEKADAPISAPDDWNLGYNLGLRAGYRAQLTALTVLQEMLHNHLQEERKNLESAPSVQFASPDPRFFLTPA